MSTILYLGSARDLISQLSALPGARAENGWLVVPRVPKAARVLHVTRAEDALAVLRATSVHAMVLDVRAEPGPFERSEAAAVLRALVPTEADAEPLLSLRRVVGVVGHGPENLEQAHALGAAGVGLIVAPTGDALLTRLELVAGTREPGKIAICLAGGGIEGLLYELGVLRALDSFLADRSVVDLDLFFGISAGAVIASLLANGVGPEEIARGLAGESARIDAIGRYELFDPNLGELAQRLGVLARNLARGGMGPRGPVSSIARAIPSAGFAGNRLRAWLQRQLTKPGMTDDFRRTRRPLYIGATDQDTSEAIVFGEEGKTDHVPVHRAVRASAALVPFYAPEKIDGRYYVDGGFSRTTNMRVAVQKGATLVILVDPLVPVYVRKAGYVYARGGVFGGMQGIKALINARFDKAVVAIREMYPDVSFHLFRPEREEMRILSGSPMKYFFRREVEHIAYESTVAKIRSRLPLLIRDFAQHGAAFRDPTAPAPRGSVPPPRLDVLRLG